MPSVPEYRFVTRYKLPAAISVEKTDALRKALQTSIKFLDGKDPSFTFPLGQGQVSAGRLKATLQAFMVLLDQHLAPDEFRKRFQEKFEILELTGRDRSHLPMLVTGYFQPVIKASVTRNSSFTYPIYGVPGDLVRVSLRQFDESLPDRTLWGRLDGHRLLPYYTRKEIDFVEKFVSAPVMAYLPGPVEGLMLQIQGSGILEFRDGTRRYIHYAASNGRPYRSIGRWLIDKGILSAQEADWPGIKAWAEKNPDAFKQAVVQNPRYVFFKWEKQGPIGSMGEMLIPMVSAALDPQVYPFSCLFFLDVSPPVSDSAKGFSGFVLNQDTGSAIKGPFRLDLYCGQGERAGLLAGSLRNKARFFIVLLR